MSTTSRAVRARLRAKLRLRRERIDQSLYELHRSLVTLQAASAAVAAGMRAGTIDSDATYELLMAVWERQNRAAEAVEAALRERVVRV